MRRLFGVAAAVYLNLFLNLYCKEALVDGPLPGTVKPIIALCVVAKVQIDTETIVYHDARSGVLKLKTYEDF